MPKNKKKESSTDSDTSFEDRTPAKKPKPEKSSDADQNPFSIQLDKNRKVSVSEFKGRVYVGIREYYDKDGKEMPSKKGISLSVPQWKKLLENADAINEQIKNF